MNLKKRNRDYKNKFEAVNNIEVIDVTSKQIIFEKEHLLKKLKIRDKNTFNEINGVKSFDTHPLFKPILGEIEQWEKT